MRDSQVLLLMWVMSLWVLGGIIVVSGVIAIIGVFSISTAIIGILSLVIYVGGGYFLLVEG